MSMATAVTKSLTCEKVFDTISEHRPRNWTQLKEQNRRGVQLFIDTLLDWQDEELYGDIKINVAVGTVISDIRPTPAIKVG